MTWLGGSLAGCLPCNFAKLRASVKPTACNRRAVAPVWRHGIFPEPVKIPHNLELLRLPMETGEHGLIPALGVLVLAAKLFNTAIERVVDYISAEQHPLAGQVKDAGSAGRAPAA
ncbi:diacylglycerol kinase [Parasedimentitalea marina]|nr:diacylglycerol kinase [Parasedimentitalea marina]